MRLWIYGIELVVILIVGGFLISRQKVLAPAPILSPAGLTVHQVRLGQAIVQAEVADTPARRQKGLSGHAPLTQDQGMLFVFPAPARQSFWMIDMTFPLDMIWIGADKKVAGITANIPAPSPGTLPQDLPLYQSPEPAQYVLEVNAGWAEKQGIKLGDQAEW